MAKVYPFRGVRYNTQKAGKLEDLITPPYDVISKDAQESYYERNPVNIIRLELGKTYPSDTDKDNQYTRAAEYYKQWLQQGILFHEKSPSLYFYEQEFSAYGQRFSRKGILCTLQLEDYRNNVVIPHEETLPKAKADRLKLMRHCMANFSSIFAIYTDKTNTAQQLFDQVQGQKPSMDLTDENGISHRVWVVQDEGIIEKWQELMSDKQVYIADGHHRYETALEFQREMAGKGFEKCNRVMVTLVNTFDPGLVVFPTYRMVHNVPGFDAQNLKEKLRSIYKTVDLPLHDLTSTAGIEKSAQAIVDALAEADRDYHNFCMYTGGNQALMFSIRRTGEKYKPEKSAEWNSLDVTILQEKILNQQLGIGDKERAEGNMLAYTRDAGEALAKVISGEFQASFLLNPTQTSEVIAVAGRGEKMPQKSTFYYPKLVTGLVINPLDK